MVIITLNLVDDKTDILHVSWKVLQYDWYIRALEALSEASSVGSCPWLILPCGQKHLLWMRLRPINGIFGGWALTLKGFIN